MLDLNKQPVSSNDGYDAEDLDHIVVPGKSSSESDNTMSSSATTFLGELLEGLQKSDTHDLSAEFITPKQHADFAQQDLQTAQPSLPLPHGQPGGMLMNARLATNLKRNAAGCLKGPRDHHTHNNYTPSGMMQSSPSGKAHTPQAGMPPLLHPMEHNPEDKPVVCGVLMSHANIPERAATPRLRQCRPSPQRTSAQMAMTEGLRARALVRRALDIHEGAAIGGTEIREFGSRSRSPTPESSLAPILMTGPAEQEAINMVDIARILHSFRESQTSSPHALLDHSLHPMPLSNLLQFNEVETSIWAPVQMATIDLDDAYELAQMSVADLLAGWAMDTNRVPILTAPVRTSVRQGQEHPTGMPDDTVTGSSEESSA